MKKPFISCVAVAFTLGIALAGYQQFMKVTGENDYYECIGIMTRIFEKKDIDYDPLQAALYECDDLFGAQRYK